MEQLLLSGLINLSELAARLYPDKPRTTASHKLNVKVRRIGYNKLSIEDKEQISKLLGKEFRMIDEAYLQDYLTSLL